MKLLLMSKIFFLFNKHKLQVKLTLLPLIVFMANYHCFSQNSQYEAITEKDMVHFRYNTNNNTLTISLISFPEELLFGHFVVKSLNGTTIGGAIFNENPAYTFTLTLPPDSFQFDTFICEINGNYNGLKYVPEMVISNNHSNWQEHWLGRHCVKLECVTFSDPPMPSVPNPFLFSTIKYYKNPKNGKVILGEKALRQFDACELKNFEIILVTKKKRKVTAAQKAP